LSQTDCIVLHVEDDDAAAYLFRAALEEARIPAVVYRVSDGEQALSFLNRTGPYEHAPQPDVVFIDLNMPRVDGWAVLGAIPRDNPIPAVVLTTSRAPSDKKRALAMGAKEYLTKASSFDHFVEEIRNVFVQKLFFAQPLA